MRAVVQFIIHIIALDKDTPAKKLQLPDHN